MLNRLFTRIASGASWWAGKPSAFIIAVAMIIIWATTGGLFDYSDTWQLAINTTTTIITFLMVFVIQNSQNRDAAALQAKLDELIRASQHARNDFIGIEHRTDAEVETIRQALEAEVAAVDGSGKDRHESHAAVMRLLRRL